jgi:hypothetical protein
VRTHMAEMTTRVASDYRGFEGGFEGTDGECVVSGT